MASPNSTNLTNFFTELSKCEQTGDFEKGHRLCNKILNADSSNRKAKLCKIICKIHLNQYEDALKEIAKPQNEDIRKDLIFEKAYCEYSLNKVDDCLLTLEKLDENDLRMKELKAQAFYKKELYLDCYDFYIDLIKNISDDFEDERATNLTAALAGLKLMNSEKQPENEPSIIENTFEQCYNNACVELGNCNYESAIKKLSKAGDICKKSMENDEATDEEIASELNMIQAQIAFAYQKLGNNKQALEIYNQILKQKPIDSSLNAIVNNNIVSINQDQNIFDSKKKMKNAVTDLEKTKLVKFQRRVILMNNLLLLLNTNQNKVAKEELNEFKNQFPNDNQIDVLLVDVTLLFNEKQTGNSVKLLEDAIKNSSYTFEDKLQLILSLAQLYLEQKDYKSSIKVLKSLDELTYRLAIISAIVSLELVMKNNQNAILFLKESIDWLKKNKKEDKNALYVLYKETSNIMIQNDDSKNAISMLEELRKANPTDPKLIINLINAYSQVNMNKAKELAKELPQIEQLVNEVDINLLESSSWSAGAKYVKKTIASVGDSLNKKIEEKVKRKRKRKVRLPKNYDPNVKPDPERWLPKWQRKTCKKKKKFNVNKGTQGSTNVPIDSTISSVQHQSPRPIGNSPAPNLTRQQRLQKKKKKGKR